MNGVFGYEKSDCLSNKLHTQALLYYTQIKSKVKGRKSKEHNLYLQLKVSQYEVERAGRAKSSLVARPAVVNGVTSQIKEERLRIQEISMQ